MSQQQNLESDLKNKLDTKVFDSKLKTFEGRLETQQKGLNNMQDSLPTEIKEAVKQIKVLKDFLNDKFSKMNNESV